jgi:cytochrome b pre-mRNA-processing protein 3
MLRLFRRKPQNPTIAAIYGAIVAQARLPYFYDQLGVPDTVEGRFEMILLHLVLVLRRVGAHGAVAQALFDRFCLDMDHNLRELGVSDLGVPRKMRAFAEAFYGRAAAYDHALASEAKDDLATALARNVWGFEAVGLAAHGLAAYVRRSVAALERAETEELSRFAWPHVEPEQVPVS